MNTLHFYAAFINKQKYKYAWQDFQYSRYLVSFIVFIQYIFKVNDIVVKCFALNAISKLYLISGIVV